MEIEYKLLDSVEAYRLRIPEVAQLFSTVFQRPFPKDAWSQWYLENPYGPPLAIVGSSHDEVVSHHALVPQKLACDAGPTELRYFLSMSTMVHPACRGLHSFIYMVDTLHEAAKDLGAEFILAFPNSNSAFLFEKLYNYTPLMQTELCSWKLTDLSPALDIESGGPRQMNGNWHMLDRCQYSVPMDSVYWNWRSKNNHAKICAVSESMRIAYKVIEPATLMLLDAWPEEETNPAERLAWFARSLGLVEARVTKHHASVLGIPDADLTPHEGYVVRFAGFPLASKPSHIRFSLLLSDVF